ncbi:MAG: hypothetical protein ACOVOR_04800 [Rhabdochlamydiaceae bacterium]
MFIEPISFLHRFESQDWYLSSCDVKKTHERISHLSSRLFLGSFVLGFSLAVLGCLVLGCARDRYSIRRMLIGSYLIVSVVSYRILFHKK